jgi:hypothetical protein
MFKYSAHPVEWKVENCVVLPKQGKATYQDPKSHRPISRLSCFGKVLESLMAQRVTKAAEKMWGDCGSPDGQKEKLFGSGCSY